MGKVTLRNRTIPHVLHGPVITNEFGQPRYWATIWADVLQGSLSEATRSGHLGVIDQLYRHVEALGGDLDAALSTCNFSELEDALGGFFTVIRNESAVRAVDGSEKWMSALRFVMETVDFLSKGRKSEFVRLQAQLHHTKKLYSQLSPSRSKGPKPVRALPARVIEELYDIFNPNSARCPFRSNRIRWRNFTIFLVLLHLGLRRGELLSLTTGAMREDLDPRTGEAKHWVTVSNLVDPEEHQFDSRSVRPGIKTKQSHRQLPLSSELLKILDLYISEFRGTPAHRFLINSQKDCDLSP